MDKEELEKDRDGIIANMNQMQGALAYIQQKLKELEEKCSEPSSEPLAGKSPQPSGKKAGVGK